MGFSFAHRSGNYLFIDLLIYLTTILNIDCRVYILKEHYFVGKNMSGTSF